MDDAPANATRVFDYVGGAPETARGLPVPDDEEHCGGVHDGLTAGQKRFVTVALVRQRDDVRSTREQPAITRQLLGRAERLFVTAARQDGRKLEPSA